MSQPERKRRGPLTWLADRTWRFWGVVGMLPVLYVASLPCWVWAHYHGFVPHGSQFALISDLCFTPVDWITDNFPTAGGWIGRYCCILISA